MFKFKIITTHFQAEEKYGPIVEVNNVAKWLSELCPDDLQIAFAPYKGQTSWHRDSQIRIIRRDDPGWWNHYHNNYDNAYQKEKGRKWSLGPIVDTGKPLTKQVPIIAISEFHKQITMEDMGYNEELISLIPTIVDTHLFSPGQKNKEITVGWIGYDNGFDKAREKKGVEVIPFLAKKFPHIQFEMVHALKPAFTHEWLKEDLPNLKIITGIAHDKMPEIIRRWHVMVCGSKWETGATSVVEAMSCGVPIIAANMQVLPEIASSQILLDVTYSHPPETEYPFDWTKESLQKFADALEHMLSDPIRYQTYVSDAIKASQRQSPENVAKKWFEFIYKCRDYYNKK
ncbi:glycosyltransferase family 4 protein [Neobacillus pocheonensis]|uniref:glycosyltransferase family 4 protein n=1 Tax=Neobacillus pocheonensis TaxID=363869 RepID=UPI003D26A5C1